MKISDKILERKYLSFFFAVFDLKILTTLVENLNRISAVSESRFQSHWLFSRLIRELRCSHVR